MKVGDLVKHANIVALGIVLKTPLETNNGDCVVQFLQMHVETNKSFTLNCNPRILKVLSESR